MIRKGGVLYGYVKNLGETFIKDKWREYARNELAKGRTADEIINFKNKKGRVHPDFSNEELSNYAWIISNIEYTTAEEYDNAIKEAVLETENEHKSIQKVNAVKESQSDDQDDTAEEEVGVESVEMDSEKQLVDDESEDDNRVETKDDSNDIKDSEMLNTDTDEDGAVENMSVANNSSNEGEVEIDEVDKVEGDAEKNEQDEILTKRIDQAKTIEDVFAIFDDVNGIQGSEKSYTSEDVSKQIMDRMWFGKFFESGITRSCGLRKKVSEILSNQPPLMSIDNKDIGNAIEKATGEAKNINELIRGLSKFGGVVTREMKSYTYYAIRKGIKYAANNSGMPEEQRFRFITRDFNLRKNVKKLLAR